MFLFLNQFVFQKDTYLDTLHKTSFLMVTAQLADRIDDLVHLPERHPIHQLIQFVEVRFYRPVIHRIDFAVSFIQKRQDGITVPEIWWIRFDIGFQFLKTVPSAASSKCSKHFMSSFSMPEYRSA